MPHVSPPGHMPGDARGVELRPYPERVHGRGDRPRGITGERDARGDARRCRVAGPGGPHAADRAAHRRDRDRHHVGDQHGHAARGSHRGGRPPRCRARLPAGTRGRAGAGGAARGPVRHRRRRAPPLRDERLPREPGDGRRRWRLAGRGGWPVRRHGRDGSGEPGLVPAGGVRAGRLHRPPDLGGSCRR